MSDFGPRSYATTDTEAMDTEDWQDVGWGAGAGGGPTGQPQARTAAGVAPLQGRSSAMNDRSAIQPHPQQFDASQVNRLQKAAPTPSIAASPNPNPYQGPYAQLPQPQQRLPMNALPPLPPPNDPFWQTVPQPPPWLLAALPFLVQQGLGSGPGFPPGFMAGMPVAAPVDRNVNSMDQASADQMNESDVETRVPQDRRRTGRPIGTPPAGPSANASRNISSSWPEVSTSGTGIPQRRESARESSSDVPYREEDELLYEYRARSPSTVERRSMKALAQGAMQHFRDLHEQRAATPRVRSGSGRRSPVAGTPSMNRPTSSKPLTAEQLRKLQEEKRARIDAHRSNAMLEKERQQRQSRGRTGTPVAGHRQRAEESRIRQPGYMTPRPGLIVGDVVGKASITKRRLVGDRPQLEDALRHGVAPRFSMQEAAATTARPITPGTGVRSRSRQESLRRVEERRQLDALTAAADGSAPGIPAAEYQRGIEDLYHRLRKTYEDLQEHPEQFLEKRRGRTQGTAAGGLDHTAHGSGIAQAARSTPPPFVPPQISFGPGSPSQQTKALVDELSKLEQQWQQLTTLQKMERGQGGSPERDHSLDYLHTLPRHQAPTQGQGEFTADQSSISASPLQTKDGVLQRLHSGVSETSAQGRGVGAGGSSLSISTEQVLERVRARARARSQSMSSQH